MGRPSKALSAETPESPASADFQNGPRPIPMGDATPMPVTTTRGVTVDPSLKYPLAGCGTGPEEAASAHQCPMKLVLDKGHGNAREDEPATKLEKQHARSLESSVKGHAAPRPHRFAISCATETGEEEETGLESGGSPRTGGRGWR